MYLHLYSTLVPALFVSALVSGCVAQSIQEAKQSQAGDPPAFDLRVDILTAEDGNQVTRFIDYQTRTVCYAWPRVTNMECHEATVPLPGEEQAQEQEAE